MHVSSMRTVGFFSIFTVSLREVFCNVFRQLSQWFMLTLNHALILISMLLDVVGARTLQVLQANKLQPSQPISFINNS
jgi:uncharacterized protein involved in response to NO